MDSAALSLWRLCALVGACAALGCAVFGGWSIVGAGTLSTVAAIALMAGGLAFAIVALFGAARSVVDPLKAIARTTAIAPSGVTLLVLRVGGVEVPLPTAALVALAAWSVLWMAVTFPAVVAAAAHARSTQRADGELSVPQVISG